MLQNSKRRNYRFLCAVLCVIEHVRYGAVRNQAGQNHPFEGMFLGILYVPFIAYFFCT